MVFNWISFYLSQRYSITDRRGKRDKTSKPSSLWWKQGRKWMSISTLQWQYEWSLWHCIIIRIEFLAVGWIVLSLEVHAIEKTRAVLLGLDFKGIWYRISSFVLNRGDPPRAPRIRSDVERSKRSGIYEGHRAEYPISPCRIRYFRSTLRQDGSYTHYEGSMVRRGVDG